MLEIGDLITLNNSVEYIVMKHVVYKDDDYLYLISKDGISDIMICSYDNGTLKVINDEELFLKLLELYNK